MIAECPNCREEAYEGELDFRPYGRGKVMLQVKAECNECGEKNIYEKGLPVQ